MRRSEWRRRANDPETLLGWWWRGIVDRPLLSDHRLLLFATLPFVVCIVMGLIGGGWGWLAIAAANLGFAASRRDKGSDRLQNLLPIPPPPEQFRAEVEYRRNGVVTGRDEMAFTFVYGWLHAEGVRSHFALRPEDARHPPSWSDRESRFVLSDGSEVRLSGLDYEARADLNAWFASQEKVKGEPTFPPARVHPQELARWQAWLIAGGMTWPTLNLIGALMSRGAEGRLVWMLPGFLMGVMVVGFGASRFRRLLRIEAQAKRQEALSGRASPLQGKTLSF